MNALRSIRRRDDLLMYRSARSVELAWAIGTLLIILGVAPAGLARVLDDECTTGEHVLPCSLVMVLVLRVAT